jgi:hypothetical protein
MGDYGPIIVTGLFGLITALLSTWFKHRLEKRGGFDIDYDSLWFVLGTIGVIVLLLGLGGLSCEVVEKVFEKRPVFPEGILIWVILILLSFIIAASYVFPCIFVAFGWWDNDDEYWINLIPFAPNILAVMIGLFTKEELTSSKDLAFLTVTLFGIMIAIFALSIAGLIGIISLMLDGDGGDLVKDGFRSLLTIGLFLIYIPILSFLGDGCYASAINKILLHYLWGQPIG